MKTMTAIPASIGYEIDELQYSIEEVSSQRAPNVEASALWTSDSVEVQGLSVQTEKRV
jgi:hypothetical protein